MLSSAPAHARAEVKTLLVYKATPQKSFGLREATIRTRPDSEFRTSLKLVTPGQPPALTAGLSEASQSRALIEETRFRKEAGDAFLRVKFGFTRLLRGKQCQR